MAVSTFCTTGVRKLHCAQLPSPAAVLPVGPYSEEAVRHMRNVPCIGTSEELFRRLYPKHLTFVGHCVADYDVWRTKLAYRRHVNLVGTCGPH